MMDDPSLGESEHRRALAGLARVHQVTSTPSRIWNCIQSCLNDGDKRSPVSILDVGCGDGYLLGQIHRLAARRGYQVQLAGCDFSATALELARAKAIKGDVNIDFLRCDVLQDPLPHQADFVINSLFLHHFGDAQVERILREFERVATRRVIIEDLARSTLGYGLCWLGTRFLSRSKIVHVDGLLSVKAAFQTEEIRQLLDKAGLQRARIESRFPERMLITWFPGKAAQNA
jgi:SAM-dependent methyltransferase